MGKVGSTIAYSLLFHPKVKNIYCHDINRKILRPELEDLDAANKLMGDKVYLFGSPQLLYTCDYVFITAGQARKSSKDSFETLFTVNSRIVYDIINEFNLDRKKVYIVTNPCKELAETLGTKYCGHKLDEVRDKHALKKGPWILDHKGYTNWGIAAECYSLIK